MSVDHNNIVSSVDVIPLRFGSRYMNIFVP
jgi:hypothetical protein